MFTGVFASQNYNTQNIADMGGRQVLGMGGSLTNYINTGKAKTDSFELTSQQPQASKKKTNVAKILAGVAAAAAAVGGTVFAFKKGGKFIDKIKAHFNINGVGAEKAKNTVDGLKEKFSQWNTNRKLANVEKKANKQIAQIDLKAKRKAAQEQIKQAQKDAAKRVKDHKKAVAK